MKNVELDSYIFSLSYLMQICSKKMVYHQHTHSHILWSKDGQIYLTESMPQDCCCWLERHGVKLLDTLKKDNTSAFHGAFQQLQ